MTKVAEIVREKLLAEASNELAIKQQQLAERQSSGKNVKAATSEVSLALARVERLQEGVTFVPPDSEPENEIAEKAAAVLTIMLDGEGASTKHLADVLQAMEELHNTLPKEDQKHYFVTRQGQPYAETGRKDKTPTTRFDNGRIIVADNHQKAIETLIKAGDECGDPYGETPPIEDGEVIVVMAMKNRIPNPKKIWVEKVERPVFRGVAPHDNSKDQRFQ
jgi:hypothetical protein